MAAVCFFNHFELNETNAECFRGESPSTLLVAFGTLILPVIAATTLISRHHAIAYGKVKDKKK
jgi:hypothetical protein